MRLAMQLCDEQPRGAPCLLPCSWRNPGKLRPSYDAGVFPQMRANQGRGACALLSRETRAPSRSIAAARPPTARPASQLARSRSRCHAAVETRIHSAGGLKAAVRIAPAGANLQRTGLLRRVVCCRRPGPSNAGVFDGGSTTARRRRHAAGLSSAPMDRLAVSQISPVPPAHRRPRTATTGAMGMTSRSRAGRRRG